MLKSVVGCTVLLITSLISTRLISYIPMVLAPQFTLLFIRGDSEGIITLQCHRLFNAGSLKTWIIVPQYRAGVEMMMNWKLEMPGNSYITETMVTEVCLVYVWVHVENFEAYGKSQRENHRTLD